MAGNTLTSSLVVRLLDQVTGPAKSVATSLLGLNKAANAASSSFGQRLSDAIARNNAALDRARASMIDAAAGFYLLKGAITGPVKEAMAFESAMADVRKVVDFPTPKAFEDFRNGLMELSKRLPVAVNGLAEIAAAAGQAGIAGADLNKFTEAAAKVGVAFDISAKDAGDAMAKLMTGLGLTIDQAVLLTDAMNHLSNAQASGASEILDVVRRVGAQGKQYGFSAEQVAAFASAMISAGAQSDVAATSFANMGRALTKGASATKRQNAAFKKLGMNSKTVAKNMQKDAVGTTLQVMEAISKLPKEMQASISSDLFGDEARALGPLLTNLKLLKESLGMVEDQSKYAGSSFREYEVRSKTFANSVQLFNNRLTALKIVIGEALIPVLNDLMGKLEPVIEKVTQWARANPELVGNIMKAAAAIIGFKVAMAGLTYLGLLGKGGALTMLALGFNTVGKAAIAAGRAAKSMVALTAALKAMEGLGKLTVLQTIGAALRGMLFAVPGVSLMAGALSAVGTAIAAITAPVWLGIAAAIAVVAAAGGLLYKYWDRVAAIFSGVAEAISGRLEPAISALKATFSGIGEFISGKLKAVVEVVRNWVGEVAAALGADPEFAKRIFDKMFDFGPIIAKVSEGLASLKAKLSAVFADLKSFFSVEVLSETDKNKIAAAAYDMTNKIIDAFAALPKATYDVGSKMIQSILDGAIAKVEELLAWLRELPAKIMAAIGNIDLSNVIKWPSMPSWLGGASNDNQPAATTPAAKTTTGHRARGGPVWPGGSFLVGEERPEIFTPKSAGTITPLDGSNGQPARDGGAKSGPTIGAVSFGDIIIPGATSDPMQTARAVREQIRAEINSLLRGAHADGSAR